MKIIAFSLCVFLSASFIRAQSTPQAPEQDLVEQIMLPSNPITDVLSVYESLTSKRLIRDANLAGPNLSITVPGSISRADAIAIIESTLLLNGYSIVPVDAGTVKILGPQRPALSEAIPLYSDPRSLPNSERIVSYYMPLRYISAKDAMVTFQGYVNKRATGSMIAVPNVNAIVITDNTPLIRRLIELQKLIDIPGTRTLSRFVALKRADAEKVVEILSKLLEKQRASSQAGAGGTAVAPAAVEGGEAPPAPEPRAQTPVFGAQVIADVRTNRVLIVAPEGEMPELERLVREMDEAVELEQPLERHLEFAKAAAVLPVLKSVLAEGTEKADAAQQLGQRDESIFNNASQGTRSGDGSNGPGGGGSKPDLLNQPEAEGAPLAVNVGKARLIADPAANNILVFGPPEAKAKAARVLAALDRRPKLVYLATVIGQLTLGDGIEVGVDYLLKFKNLNPNGPTSGVAGLLRTTSGFDILADPSKVLSSAANSLAGTATGTASAAAPLASGLTVYGTIAESVDIYAKALATTNRFKVLHRPVVFTTNNTKAVISSGQSVPIPVSSLTSAITSTPNDVGTAITSNIQYKDVVLKLEVIPLVNSASEVTLTIGQQNDSLLESVLVSNNQVPVIGTQTLTTTVTVKNRETIVLGGLITEEKQRSRTGIPLLSSVPGLGYLFSTNKRSTTRRELIIMIQPLIVNSEADLAEANDVYQSMSAAQSEFYEDGLPVRRAQPVLPDSPRRRGDTY